MLKIFGRPSLQTCLAAIVIVMLAPTLVIVTLALMKSGEAQREASSRQLLETARVVAQSVENELEVTAHLVRGFGELGRHEKEYVEFDTVLDSFLSGETAIFRVSGGEIIESAGPFASIPAVAEVVLEAAQTRKLAVSNIIMIDTNGTELPHIALAAPDRVTNGTSEIIVEVGNPVDIVRALSRQGEASGSAVLAITDGNGRIIGRSVDGERFVGRPVPNWDRLIALGTPNGTFRALTIEGNQIVFSFQRINGTPGWTSVVGEPAASFDGRWMQPLVVMLALSALTMLCTLAFAFMLARRVLNPIRHLVARAQAIASGDSQNISKISAEVPSSFVSEFELLRTSLDEADAVLRNSLEDSQRAEHEARQNEAALQQAEKIARIGSWTLDLTTNEFTCSDMLYELNGADPKGPPLKLDDLPRLLAPESWVRMQEAIAACISTGEPYGLEVEHLRDDDHNFPAYVQGQVTRDEEGRAVSLSGTVQDITEQTEQRRRLAVLADNLPSGVIFRLERGSDGAIRIVYVSAGIDRLIGRAASDVMHRADALFEVIHEEDITGLFEALEHSQASGDVLDHEFRVANADKRFIWIHARAAMRLHPDGHRVWDGIARDTTTERETAEVLRDAKETAEAAEQAKSDFLATMSHEIRTPMNTVIGMTRLALQTNLNAKQRNYLEKIDGSASVLLGIINDVLDFSKIEAGGLKLEGAVFSLESVLDSVSTVTALKAEEKGLELAFAVDRNTPQLLKGDPLRLGQVLTNLVGNAVKFTEQGDVLVSIRPAPNAQSANTLEFSVLDTGIGLNPAQIQSLFRPFTQASSDTSRRYGGTGLGLAICKRLVELMGGEIRVDSEPGKGSTFTFTAVLEPVHDSETPATATRLAHDLKGRRVLICDDSPSARTALSDMLSGFGLDTETVDSGTKAIEMLRNDEGKPFDMVLLDWRMPGIDGIETARQIKADARLLRMPAVLMVTAYGHELVAKAVEEMSLEGLLLKPVTQSVMFNTLQAILAAPGMSHGLQHGRPKSRTGQLDAYRKLAGYRVLVVDDNAFNREVASDFLLLVGVEVETAVNGLDAIRKMESTDYDVVLMDMHMPEMNGLEAVREIRRRPQWQKLPVIALTAQARVEDHRASLEAGMTAHLTKPIDENALFGTLMDVLGLSASSPDKASSETAATAANDVIDLEALMERFGGNTHRVSRLMSGFQREFSDAPAQFRSMVERGATNEVAELVHQIKGGAGYLGATELSSLADTLEHAARNDDHETVTAMAGMFEMLLNSCLSALGKALGTTNSTPQENEGSLITPCHAIGLIDRIIPLVQRGDFAGKPLLEELSNGVRDTEHAAQVEKIQDLYDELELSEAVELLEALKAELSLGKPAGA